MTIDRNKLCAGLMTRSNFLSMEHPRKVVFSYDEYEATGYDVVNDKTYPMRKAKNFKEYYITNFLFLNPTLQLMGYPEKLSDVHIERIMNEDFEKVFVESGVMRSLYSCSMENYPPLLYKDTCDIFKNEFKIRDEELKLYENSKNYQKQKRRF